MRSAELGFFSRALCVAAASLLLAGLFAQTTLYSRVVWWFEDSLQRLFGPTLPMDHVVVFDVDEESMQRLEPTLGAWPYSREVYATASRFLSAQGARAVVFDILFSEPRDGDDAFARALGHTHVLAAAALPYSMRRPAAYHEQLRRGAPFGAESDPVRGMRAQPWLDLTLPLPKLTESGAGVGVISVVADQDGAVRRLPLLHRAYGEVLPSLTLASLIAAGYVQGSAFADGEFRLGTQSWPLAADGSVPLRYPGNPGALPVVPFFQLVAAAENAQGTAHVGDLVRDKIVFLGSSSAVLGDFAYTPAGRLPGLQLNALFTELLLEGQLRRPSMLWLDFLIVALALAVPVAMVRREVRAPPRDFLIGLGAICVVVAGAGIALAAVGQDSRWLFALLAGVAAQTFAIMLWLFALHREKQRLFYEKAAAQEASRMKSRFLSHMTHELRTPLTAIMAFNKINQLTDDLGREQRVLNSAIVDRNCEHLLALVSNNLDLARIEVGQLSIERKPEDAAALLQDVVSTMRVMADEKGLALKLSVDGRIPGTLSLDAFRLRQVLINLLGNAVKFTVQGEVVLEASWEAEPGTETAGTLELRVRDTGVGIPPASLARVFEPFQRAVAQGVTGTGLGLTITRELVGLMGGTIAVESVPGEGTVFTVRMPAPVVAGAARSEPPKAAGVPLSGSVLVAEDNEHLRLVATLYLRQLDVSCRVVGNGFEAVEAALGGEFDALLMDMEMPVMDGYEAVRVLRERGYRGPIIAFTANDTPLSIERARREGCDGVLRKPFTVELLRTALEPFLGDTAARSPRRDEDIPVKVDPRLRDLIPTLLAKCRCNITEIRAAIDSNDLTTVHTIGHSLKGSGGSYGFDEITVLGGEIERASRTGDAAALRRLADRLESYLARVRPVFHESG